MRSSTPNHLSQMQTPSPKGKEKTATIPGLKQRSALLSAPDSNENWHPNLHKRHLAVRDAIEKVTPRQPSNDFSDSIRTKEPATPLIVGRTSISSESRHRPLGQHAISISSTSMMSCKTDPFVSNMSENASESDYSTSHSFGTQRSKSCPRFAQHTVSSRIRNEKVIHETSKRAEWRPSFTRPKSPRLRCVGKKSSFKSIDQNDKPSDYSSTASTSNRSKASSQSGRGLEPSVPRTPNVLRRRVFYPRKSTSPEVPNRTFVPNPVPCYLTNPKLPEVKPTKKSMQLEEWRKNPTRVPKEKPPRKVVELPERTIFEPFSLESVVKHEERVYQIMMRNAREEEEDRKQREFNPVPLQCEILDGPTFVPTRSEVPPTKPVDLIPGAGERRERTLAFEASQRARMEEMDRNKQLAKEEHEKAEEERLRREYEIKRFKARPVPNSHYSPDIAPVETRRIMPETGQLSGSPMSTQQKTSTPPGDSTRAEDVETEPSDVPHYICNTTNTPTASESRAVTILEGIRKSLSPLLGRGLSPPS